MCLLWYTSLRGSVSCWNLATPARLERATYCLEGSVTHSLAPLEYRLKTLTSCLVQMCPDALVFLWNTSGTRREGWVNGKAFH